MSRTVRNVAIIALVALAIVVLPGGSGVADLAVAAVSLAFLSAIAWFGYRLYVSGGSFLWGLTTAMRSLLYGALAVAFMTLTASARLTDSGPGTLAWLALLAGSAFAVYHVWKESRRYTF